MKLYLEAKMSKLKHVHIEGEEELDIEVDLEKI